MVYFPPSGPFFPTLRLTPTPSPVLFGPFSLYLCLVCELCSLYYSEVSSYVTHTPPKHTWVKKAFTQMQHNNFQKKTGTKHLLIIPISTPVHGTVRGHLSYVASCPSPHTDTLMRTRHARVMDNTLGLPGGTDGLHKSFFFLMLIWINIFQFFIFKECFNR